MRGWVGRWRARRAERARADEARRIDEAQAKLYRERFELQGGARPMPRWPPPPPYAARTRSASRSPSPEVIPASDLFSPAVVGVTISLGLSGSSSEPAAPSVEPGGGTFGGGGASGSWGDSGGSSGGESGSGGE
jgi:uncharacterized membrane protein YgcG